MRLLGVAAGGVGRSAPSLGRGGGPKMLQRRIAIDVDNNDAAASCVISEAMTASKMSSAPAMASGYPLHEEFEISELRRPTFSRFALPYSSSPDELTPGASLSSIAETV